MDKLKFHKGSGNPVITTVELDEDEDWFDDKLLAHVGGLAKPVL